MSRTDSDYLGCCFAVVAHPTRLLRRLGAVRGLAVAGLVLLTVTVAVSDMVAGAALLIGMAAVTGVVRRRSVRALRMGTATLLTGVTLAAVGAALGTYSTPPPVTPLLLSRTAGSADAPGETADGTVHRPDVRAASVVSPGSGPVAGAPMQSLGFVVSDLDESPLGVDRDAAALSDIAATGITLDRHPGSIAVLPPTDALVRAQHRRCPGPHRAEQFRRQGLQR